MAKGSDSRSGEDRAGRAWGVERAVYKCLDSVVVWIPSGALKRDT